MLLCEDGVHWNTWVHDWEIVDRTDKLVTKGKAKNNIFARSNRNFDIIACILRISFTSPPGTIKRGFLLHRRDFVTIVAHVYWSKNIH